MTDKTKKLIKGLKQGFGGVRQRIEIANPLRRRSPSPCPSAQEASSATNDLDVSRATSVSSHRDPQAKAVERGRGSLPNRPRESSETSNTQPRSTPPSQTAMPSIVINSGQAIEGGEISSLMENRRPQSPVQEKPKSGLEHAFDKLSDPQKIVLQGYGLGTDTDGDPSPSERFNQQLQKIRELGDQCSNEPKEVQNGKPFLTCGRVYNILRKIEKFAKFGDIAIQHHPDVVALVWASLRMLLQVALNDLTTFDRLSSSLDDIATLMCSCRRFEELYSKNSRESAQSLIRKLPLVYGSCLKLIAEALIYVEENTSKRVLEGVTNPFEIRFQPLIDDIQKQKGDLEGSFSAMALHENVEALCAQQSDVEQRDALEWLSNVKYQDHHNFAKKDRFHGTGKWLLKKDDFDKWLKVESSILWVNGKPGAGKTVLASYIIDTLQNTYLSTPVVFFYCSYKEEERRTAHTISRTLLKQLFSKEPSLEPKFVSTFKKERKSGHPSTSLSFLQTKEYFEAAMTRCGDLFIVVDALDECETAERDEIATFLGSLLGGGEAYRVKILITSRPEDDLSLAFDGQSSYRIDVNDTTNDIEPFVASQVKELVRSKKLLRGDVSQDLQEKIIDTLNHKADGMFLWVRYQLDGICRQGNSDQVREQLKRLPRNLPETYKQMWQRIKAEGNEQIASKALAWLLCAVRPLSPQEIIQAVAVDLGSAAFQQHMYPVEHIIAACGNFVSLDARENVLRFEHYSVQEFLKGYEFQEAGSFIARSCFAVLTLSEPPQDVYSYVAEYWQEHARSWKDTADPADPIERFLFDKASPQSWTCYTKSSSRHWPSKYGEPWSDFLEPEPIHLICHFNLIAILRYFLRRQLQNLETCQTLSEALVLAVRNKGNEVAEFLLNVYPQVDLSTIVQLNDSEGGTALIFAAYNDSELIVKRLLEANADVNFYCYSDGYSVIGNTALQAAFWRGGEEVIHLLLDAGAYPDGSVEGYEGSLLQQAAFQGMESIVKLLLKANADVNLHRKAEIDGVIYNTALQAAVSSPKPSEKAVQLLLEAGADPNDSMEGRGTALQMAAFWGEELIVKHLLQAGADVNFICRWDLEDCNTAMQAAVSSSETTEKVVQLLLEAGADPNDSTEGQGTALQIAALRSDELVVKHLLQAGADVNFVCERDFKGIKYNTALQAAVSSSETSEKVVQLLLEAGADPNHSAEGQGTALQIAAVRGPGARAGR